MPSETPDHEEVLEIASNVHKTTSDPETIQPPSKMIILPGRTLGEHEDHPGKPAAYFVRTEGTTDTVNMQAGSIESMLEDLMGHESTDFIVGINSPEQMLHAAEELKTKLGNPEIQQRIRRLHAEREKLKEDLG